MNLLPYWLFHWLCTFSVQLSVHCDAPCYLWLTESKTFPIAWPQTRECATGFPKFPSKMNTFSYTKTHHWVYWYNPKCGSHCQRVKRFLKKSPLRKILSQNSPVRKMLSQTSPVSVMQLTGEPAFPVLERQMVKGFPSGHMYLWWWWWSRTCRPVVCNLSSPSTDQPIKQNGEPNQLVQSTLIALTPESVWCAENLTMSDRQTPKPMSMVTSPRGRLTFLWCPKFPSP